MTSRSALPRKASLERRRGGGGHGGSHGGGEVGGGGESGGGSHEGSTGGGSSHPTTGEGSSGTSGGGLPSSGGDSSSTRSTPISTSGTTKGASPFSPGGGSESTIPSGQVFAGRQVGGGTRSEVYGTRVYGSGYPGQTTRGVDGRPFPFYFWPVVWGNTVHPWHPPYLHSQEYGRPDNTSRPGAALATATFVSSSFSNNLSTFHLVADNATVASLITDITANCSTFFNTSLSSTAPIAFNDSDPNAPEPEETIQYYRASSVALTLDGYNNTAVFLDDSATGNDNPSLMSPLPQNVDLNLLNCLNATIGARVPLVDASELTSTGAGTTSGAGGIGPSMAMCHLPLLTLVMWFALWSVKM